MQCTHLAHIIGFCIIFVISCGTPAELRTDSIPVVSSFNLERYLGTWYEIARLPNKFEENLEKITATYTLNEDGEIAVLNRGFNVIDQEWEEASGKAWVPDPAQPARLRVSFFWIFASDYKIIALDNNYQYALVTSSSKEYLWILARDPVLDEAIYQKLVALADMNGFDTAKLIRVTHN